jgi:anaerobic selenocysteine-containing dehydrogenase
MYPLKRVGERGEGKWERISWDEACDLIAERVSEIRDKYGPEAIATFGGTGRNYVPPYARLAGYGFGTPNGSFALSGFSCWLPKVTFWTIIHGGHVEQDLSPDRFDDPRWKVPECTIIWGSNPIVSNHDGYRGWSIVECMKRGGKLIVVDPSLTWLASRADIWLQLRPGTDGALALGMLNVIINEGLYDKKFVEKWTHGFEALKERVQEYPPGKVAEITWVPEEKIIEAAKLFAKSKPAVIHTGVCIEMASSGMSTCQAIQQLWSITGNLEVPGGMTVVKIPEPISAWAYYGGLVESPIPEETMRKKAGWDEYFLTKSGPSQVDRLMEVIFTGKPYPIKMIWFQTSNPLACTGQEPRRLCEALNGMDFVVVADLFMTPTAMMADLVLPVASALERDSFRWWWAEWELQAINKVIELGECKTDEEIALTVGKRLNPEAFPWKNAEEYLDDRLKGLGMTFKELREEGPIFPKPEYERHEKGLLRPDGQPGFATPTGRVELYSTIFEQMGLDPLPSYQEPPESPVSTPDLNEEYPFVFTNGGRSWVFFHSEHRHIPEFREIHPQPITDIHPDDAERLGIKDRDWIWIENRYGRCKQIARVTPTILKGVVHAEHGWWFPEKPGPQPSLFGTFESNPNNLIPYGSQGPSGLCAPIRCQLCKVYKVEG